MMMAIYDEYKKLFEDPEYFLSSRVFVRSSNGESTQLSTRFPMDNLENLKVETHGYDNRIRIVTYKSSLLDDIGNVLEMYHKRNINMSI